VKGGVMVLHGYQRPGHGWIVGDCIGVGHKPLNETDEQTKSWRDEYMKRLMDATTAHERAAHAERDASKAIDDAGESRFAAQKAKPFSSARHSTPEQMSAHLVKMDAWRAEYPLNARWHDAMQRTVEARRVEGQMRAMTRHFIDLLEAKITGTPLTIEVVA
jgi:hypothetical protein